jgi:hypothetical protein
MMVQSEVLKPFCYAYRYPSFPPAGATVIRFGTGGREINGSKPIEAIPLYKVDQPTRTPAVATDEGVVELAVKLLAAWDDFLASDANQQEAYYLLAKAPWGIWEELRAAISAMAHRP